MFYTSYPYSKYESRKHVMSFHLVAPVRKMPAFYVEKWNHLELNLSKLIGLLVIAVTDGIMSTVSGKMSMNNAFVTKIVKCNL